MHATDPVVAAILRGMLALVFLQAALHKFADRGAFRTAVAGYDLLPAALVNSAAALLPLLEVLAAMLLAVPTTAAPGGLLAAGLLALYGAAIAAALARGRRDIDCGCGGPARAVPVRGALLVRNGLLALAALACAGAPSTRAITRLDWFTGAVGIAAASALLAAIESLLATAPARARLEGRA